MATLLEWTNGALPTVAGNTVTYASDTGYPTAGSIRIAQNVSDVAYVLWSTNVSAAALRFYIRTPSAWSSTSAMLCTLGDGPSGRCRIYIGGDGAPGQVRLSASSTTVANSSNGTIMHDTWYRFELQVNSATSEGRAAVFAIDSTAPSWDSGWVVHPDFTQTVTRVQLGRCNANPTVPPFHMDSIIVTDSVADWVGPIDGDEVADPVVQVWNGTALITPAFVQVWNGTALVAVEDITVV